MKQHHQRILRLWRCPECDRTVRLPGRVTTRTCRCTGEATMMQLQQTDRIRKFDIDSFVSYQSEEDLTPTAAELIEEIPKHLMPIGPTEEEIAAKAAKPRRGKAYLRTEIDEESAETAHANPSAPEVDDFGAGIESDLPTTAEAKKLNPSDGTNAITADSGTDPESPSEGTGKKRKRRRRRRGRSAGRRDGDQEGQSSSANETDADSQDVASSTVSVRNNEASISTDQTDGESATTTNAAGKKRRRRRRRRGKGGTQNSVTSDGANKNSNSSSESGNTDAGNSAPNTSD